ncbi:hypothetical protein D9M71_664440 [compost metagenome]
MATRQVLAQFVGCERQGRRPRFQLAIVAGLKQEAGRQAECDLEEFQGTRNVRDIGDGVTELHGQYLLVRLSDERTGMMASAHAPGQRLLLPEEPNRLSDRADQLGLIRLSAGMPNISCSFQIIGKVRERLPLSTS